MNWWTAAIRSKGAIYAVAAALTVGMVLLRVWDPLPLQMLRFKTFDVYQRVEPRVPAPLPIVIVDLDDESLAAYGQWPWPRSLLADLVNNLMAMGAGVIGFDIVFSEPDRLSPDRVAEALRGIDDAARQALARLPANDTLFAQTIKRARVVLGQSMTSRPQATASTEKARKTQVAELGGDPRPSIYAYLGMTRNLPELEAAAAGLGIFTIKPEIDGIVRRVPMIVRYGDDVYPTLALDMLRVATGQNAITVKSDRAGINSILIQTPGGGITIPTDAAGRTWVNYAPHDRGRYVSAKDVLAGTAPASRFRGHFVFVGTSAIGLQDLRATPVADAMPGVEIHAQLLETILSDAYLYRPSYAITVELVVLIAMSVLMTVMIARVGAAWSLFAGGALVGILIAGSWYLYVERGVLLGVAYIAIGSFLLYSILTYLNYVREQAERRQVRTAFSQYMSPALVDRLAEHPEDLMLGGEMREMSMLFCDIRGFTGISELYKSDPQGLTRLINRFLTPMTDLILARRGTIDKYMGDCIMAFWNAPLDDEDHARNACVSALAMIEGIKTLNQDLRDEADRDGKRFIPINIGIGINTGVCCVGNMGSSQRFDYSVLGDDVNLASRLEGQSKTYGVAIVIGENTLKKAGDVAAIELDLIKVKGKNEAVRIFALLGEDAADTGADFEDFNGFHGAMINAYRRQHWFQARQLIGECRRLNGGLNALYDLYETRIGDYQENPPDRDWDGVYVATSK